MSPDFTGCNSKIYLQNILKSFAIKVWQFFNKFNVNFLYFHFTGY